MTTAIAVEGIVRFDVMMIMSILTMCRVVVDAPTL